MSAEALGWLFIMAGFIIPVVVIAIEAKKATK